MNRMQSLLLAVCSAIVLGGPVDFDARAEEPGNENKTGTGKNEESKSYYKLEELLVVAPPVIEGNRVNRLGSQETIVTGKQIEDLNAQDLPSALRRTPGVVVSHHNPVGSFGGGEGGAIFIRGMGISRPGAEIQMLVDGIPKFVSVWTHPLMDVLSVDVIDQMKVYKGAQPVLFGNMAFAAVDITTKRKKEDGFVSTLGGSGGSFNTWTETAEHGGKTGPFDYYLVQSYRTSDGHRDNADGELQNYFGRVGYQFSPNWYAGVIFNRTDNEADDPGPTDGSAFPQGRFKTNDYFSVATVSNNYNRAEGYLKLYWENGHIDWVDQYNTTTHNNVDDTITDYDNYGVKGRETFRPWTGGEIMAGMDIDFISGKVDIKSPTSPNHFDRSTFHIYSPHFSISQMFGSRDSFYSILSWGFRYMIHSEFSDEFAPQYGIIVGHRNTEFHASYARGVNYPGVFAKANDEMFMPGNNRWRDLEAETMDHCEVGISQRIGDVAALDFTFFYDHGKNRIVVDPPPPFPPTWRNISSFSHKGAEATVTVTPISDLSFMAGATYLDRNPGDLPYAPRWSASFGANYRFLKHFQLSMDASYVDDQFVTSRSRTDGTVNTAKVDSYFLLNGKLSYDFAIPFRDMHGEIFVAGENLTDENYQQKKGYPMPGISGSGGLKFWF